MFKKVEERDRGGRSAEGEVEENKINKRVEWRKTMRKGARGGEESGDV